MRIAQIAGLTPVLHLTTVLHLTRFSTGALLGAVAVFYLMPGLVELSSTMMRRFARN